MLKEYCYMISREYSAIRSQNDYWLPYRHYCLQNQPFWFFSGCNKSKNSIWSQR